MIKTFSLLLMGIAPLSAESVTVGQAFAKWLSQPISERPPLAEQSFATTPLTKKQAETANNLLWQDHVATVRAEREAEMTKKAISLGEEALRFDFKVFGNKPADGHSLYISMHGGGNTKPEVNDKQWQNQIGLYEPKEGIYVAPRAPSDTWNLWHRSHIDPLFDRLIEDFVILKDVNPNRIYLMGYSAGGDGVYQLAPRMADRFAAAAMMAGHPNETKPDGLRNLAFTLHMGGNDAAYKRNEIAGEWKTMLENLHKEDPDGYTHDVQIHPDKGHWMEREDAVAVPWMAQFTRNPHPKKIVWLQDDVTHPRFYWLSVAEADAAKEQKVVASLEGQTITIEEATHCPSLNVLLTDALINLDEDVRIVMNGNTLFQGKVDRTIQALADSLQSRPDRTLQYWARVPVNLP